MNKHGFKGVRKRTDGRAKPYYARFRLNGRCLYTKSHETAEKAANEYVKYTMARAAIAPVPLFLRHG
jgi:hypothetical protein